MAASRFVEVTKKLIVLEKMNIFQIISCVIVTVYTKTIILLRLGEYR